MNKLLISIKLAGRSLQASIGRTVLSLLGVTIGVAAVILIISLGAGMKSYVVGMLEDFGTDFLQIEVKVPKTEHISAQNVSSMAGGSQVTTFKLAEAEKISQLENISSWYGGMMGQELMSYKGSNKRFFIFGVTSGISEVDNKFEIENGVMFTDEDARSGKRVAVIGSGVKESFFKEIDPIGKNIKMRNQSFEVIGVAKDRGSSGFFDFDELVFMPIETLQKSILGVDYIQFAIFNVKDTSKFDLTKLQMEDLMRRQHDITDPDDDDFAIMSSTEALGILDQVFLAINFLLISFAGISLIVGGVGITNVMYVAVTERTSEIGLRKSLGAKNSDVLWQFVAEAVFITLMGGFLGIFLGFVLAKLAEFLVAGLGYSLSFPISFSAVALGMGFSVAIGLIFGIRPALKASKLSPMEALRKE